MKNTYPHVKRFIELCVCWHFLGIVYRALRPNISGTPTDKLV